MDGLSLTPQEEKLKALQLLLPEVFAEGKIDWEKLKATLGEDVNFSNERYVLNWAGKSDAFKVLQTPTTKTLIPAKDESINFDETENIFIEGENLEVLKVLQKSYFGKVKMIYIDPPYNTGSDSFIYPDKFSETIAEYEKRVGDKDEEGYMTKDGMFRKNSKENGQYHSNWLNMMMPRLYLAKNLLKQDGVIFVSIDDNEVHNLRLMMNEIFGEENFLSNFIWKKKGTTSNVEGAEVSSIFDNTLCYKKSINFKLNQRIFLSSDRKYNLNDSLGYYRTTVIEKKNEGSYYRDTMIFEILGKRPREGKRWQIGEETARKLETNNRFIFDGEKILLKIYDFEDKDTTSAQPNILDNHGSSDSAMRQLKQLFDNKSYFDTPKPVDLINHFLKIATQNEDIILDFFSGSGTTAQAVIELNKSDGGNRKYICVQMPELCDEKSEAFKAGYKTIAEISKERIRRVKNKINNELKSELENNKSKLEFEKIEIKKLDLGFKVLKLAESNFKVWQQIQGKDIKALSEQINLFVDPIAEIATIENMVYELLLKSGKDLNSKIEKRNEYFVINNGELILLLEKTSQEIVENVIAEKPKKVIALDKLFKENDQLKTNTVLQMRDAEIEFKTI